MQETLLYSLSISTKRQWAFTARADRLEILASREPLRERAFRHRESL